MLVQLPRRSPQDQALKGQDPQRGERSSFEAALRRDLASQHVVAYDSIVGGVGKRAADIILSGLTAPIWGLAILVAFASVNWRAPRAWSSVFFADERVGYGGKLFTRWRMNLTPPSAEIVELHPQPEAQGQAPEPQLEPAVETRIGWRDVIERLPELLNVLRGDMSLIGPRPILHQEFEDLRGAGKYYASVRPGFISASDCGRVEGPQALLYKYYAMQWSPALDLRIIKYALLGNTERS